MSIFTNFSKVWHHLTDEGKALFSDDLKAVFDFLAPLAHALVKDAGQVLIIAAKEAVIAAQAAGGSGGDKFEVARKTLENVLRDKGLPIIENDIRGAIEAAVAQLKAAPTNA